eukprot:tig00000254_g22554.t1
MSRLATSECPPPQLNEVHATRTYTSRGLAERAAQLAAKESSLAELDCQLAGVSVSANAKFRTDDRLARSIVSKAEKSILKIGCSALAKPGKKKKKKTAAVEEEEKASEDVDAEPVDVARRKARRARSSSRPFEDAPLPRHELADVTSCCCCSTPGALDLRALNPES